MVWFENKMVFSVVIQEFWFCPSWELLDSYPCQITSCNNIVIIGKQFNITGYIMDLFEDIFWVIEVASFILKEEPV